MDHAKKKCPTSMKFSIPSCFEGLWMVGFYKLTLIPESWGPWGLHGVSIHIHGDTGIPSSRCLISWKIPTKIHDDIWGSPHGHGVNSPAGPEAPRTGWRFATPQSQCHRSATIVPQLGWEKTWKNGQPQPGWRKDQAVSREFRRWQTLECCPLTSQS